MTDGFTCPMCGKEKYCVSTATFRCGYGSIYDGDVVHVELCGECVDKIIANIPVEYIEFIESEKPNKIVNIFNYY